MTRFKELAGIEEAIKQISEDGQPKQSEGFVARPA
jgi:hypothetical protein